MANPNSTVHPSLLPYLRPRAQGISLSFRPTDSPDQDQIFATLEASGPLADIRLGQVTIDGQNALVDLFFLVQADHYDFQSSELQPVSNTDVENAWQQAWAQIRNIQDASPLAPALPAQIDAQGDLVPLRSLFYCRYAQAFCHPLCPVCGTALSLCRDDAILNKARLAGYGKSLQRYLYCADCHQASQEAPFYTKILPPAPPARVKGCKDLIRDFSRLLAKNEFSAQLPCAGCDEAANCYGAQTLALERMQAINFYPFFMLMQPAPTLNALDFLALLSGAEVDQIRQHLALQQRNGRLSTFEKFQPGLSHGSGFLFEQDTRHFLEIFYLKLTFLREMSELINRGPANTASRMSMEGLWVHLNVEGMRLPYLWNFSLQLIDPLGQPGKQPVDFSLPQAQLRVFLGAAWYYVLLVNAGQSMDDINDGIHRFLELNGGEPGDLFPSGAIDTLFEARNIFWQSPETPMDPEWEKLWQESLALGMKLLCAGLYADDTWSNNAYFQQIDDLRARVHQSLFLAPAAESLVKIEATDSNDQLMKVEAIDSSDQQIAGILTDIFQQWAQSAPLPTPPPTIEETVVDAPPIMRLGDSLQPNEDGDYAQTVILSREERLGQDHQVPDIEETVAPAPSESQQSTGDMGVARQAPVIDQAPSPPQDLDATVAMSAPSAPVSGQDLDATVVPSAPSAPASGQDPDATVVMSSPSAPTTGQD